MQNKIKIQGLSKMDLIKLKEKVPPSDIIIENDNFMEYSQNDIPLTEVILAATPLVLGILALILRPKSTNKGKITVTSFKQDKEGNIEKKNFQIEYDDKHVESNYKALKELSNFFKVESA